MSRYFKYKTAEALALDARSRGLDIRLRDDLAPLGAPTEVGGRRVGNRLAIHPMEGCDGTLDGAPGDLTVRRFRRFGEGGAKLIWGEAAAVVPEGRANPRQLLMDESHARGLRGLADACRSSHAERWGRVDDLLIGIQLTHSGRYSARRPVLAQHHPLLDPRTVVDRATGAVADRDTPLISDAELDRLQDRYAAAASLALRVGFDFVDIKQCHGYLLNELLSSRTRPGRYGGSFENRTRFIREVVGRIHSENPGTPIGTRLNVYDGIPYRPGVEDRMGVPCPYEPRLNLGWGMSPDDPFTPDLGEPIALIGLLRDLGLTMVSVSMGNPYTNPHVLRPFEYAPVDGYETPEHPMIGVDRHFRMAEAVQAAFPELAVVGSGYSWLQAYLFQAGAANVGDGRIGFVGVGRASLAQPEFGRHVLLGEALDPKRICRTFSYCTALMRAKHNELGQFATGCPPFDKDVYGPIWDEAKKAPAGPLT